MENYLVLDVSSGRAEIVKFVEDGDLLVGNISFFSNMLLEKLKEGNTVNGAVSYLLVNFLNSNVLKPLVKELANVVPSQASLPNLNLSLKQVALLVKKIDVVSVGQTRRIYNAFRSIKMEFNWHLAMFGDNFEVLFIKVRKHLSNILNRKCSDIIELDCMESYKKIVPFIFDQENVKLKDFGLGYFSCGLISSGNVLQPIFRNEYKVEKLLLEFQSDCTNLLISTLKKPS